MSDVQLSPMEIRGKKYTVWLSDKGEFRADLGGIGREVVRSETLDGLRDKIARATKRETLQLKIPAIQLKHDGGYYEKDAKRYWLEPITLRGLHGGNGNVMIADSKGKVDQDSGTNSWEAPEFFRVMSPAEQKELMRLKTAMTESQKDYVAYAEARKINPRDLIKAELEKVNALD